MAYEKLIGTTIDYDPCEYPGSKLMFRGPRRELGGSYIAFLGSTETYGKFIEEPYPALVEKSLGVACVNFGWSNAGPDVYLNDPGVLIAAREAKTVVLQLPCAQNMSNRYYTVHPRRNDRFVEPSERMRRVFPDVDFTQFHFTRHLLNYLQHNEFERFSQLQRELQTVWVARMRTLLSKLETETILLWFSKRRPSEDHDTADVSADPTFVTRSMIDAVGGQGAELVEVCASPAAIAAGTAGMVFSKVEETAASELLGPIAHKEAGDALARVLADRIT